jgi:hypothetical protein
MSRTEAWLCHAANLLVGGTGLVYAWFRYFARPVDELAIVHPWSSPAQHAHVLAAPLLVFALGLVVRGHVVAGLRLGIRERRRSGLLLVAGALPMVLSGSLIQVAIEPAWRRAWVVVHLAASGLWLAATVAHQLSSRRR